ncbi:glycogenin glucosyltransferase [Coemansia sp. RSA 1365]|nr:glycogenin glucosyltransferase [Coemansia sp. RSA 1365]
MTTTLSTKTRVCFATLLTTDSYLHGALTLAASLRATGTAYEIICLVADGQLSRPALERLQSSFDRVVNIPILQSANMDNLALMGRPDLGSTLTKIGVWALTEYERIAFLDADTLVLGSIDSLLDTPLSGIEQQQANEISIGQDIRPNGGMRNEGLLAAAADLGWPDCFNSGVFVAKPSKTTHAQLLNLLANQGSFDGGDQGLLNAYFSDWSHADHSRRLPFAYNTTSTSFYSYAPAFVRFSPTIKIVHFIGLQKPWKCHRSADGSLHGGDVDASFSTFVEQWWKVHDKYVSLWSPDKGPYDSTIALSLNGRFENQSYNEPSEDVNMLSSDTGMSNIVLSHATDNSWKRDGEYHEMGGAQNTANDSWGSFTPAHDFTLD